MNLHNIYTMNLQHLITEFTDWSSLAFAEATAFSSLRKCREELVEISGDLVLGKDPTEEYVDAVMSLFDSARRAGIDTETFVKVFRKKLAINKNRTWKKNDDNTYSHL